MTEAERLRSLARSNEAAALRHARETAKAEERAKWEPEIMSLREEVAKLRSRLEER